MEHRIQQAKQFIETTLPGYTIDQNGITTSSDGDAFDTADITQAIRHIPQFLEPSGRYNTSSSYGIKHICSDFIQHKTGEHGYITNGDFIIAMVICGYTDIRHEDLNVYFKCQKIESVDLYNFYMSSRRLRPFNNMKYYETLQRCHTYRCQNRTHYQELTKMRGERNAEYIERRYNEPDRYCNQCQLNLLHRQHI